MGGGLRERPLAENWGLSERTLTEKSRGGILELKLTNIFFQRWGGVFWSSPGRKSRTNKCMFLKRRSFGAVQVEKLESL